MTGVRITKPWQDLTAENVAKLRGHLGIYQLAATDGEIVLIAYAGGRSRFGLAGELRRHLEAEGGPLRFRTEVTMGYWSRYKELLMTHLHDHGRLPVGNTEDPARVGRIDPS